MHTQTTILPPVITMLHHCSLLLVLALVNADPITDHSVEKVQDQWKQYRTIVSDSGFLYNESFVVINDYDESPDSNPNNDSDIIPSDPPKLGFEKTLMGMVSALQDIQRKGDQMMSAITDQKQVLVKLRSEVAKAEERLEEAVQITAAMETKRNDAENEIKTAERNTRMLSQRKSKIESELEILQNERESAQNRLESLQEELRAVTEEMENLSNLRQASLTLGRLSCSYCRSSLTPLQKNLESRQNELSNLERSLLAKTSELSNVKQQIATSTKILE